jgi:hypothetical protein
MIVGMGVWVNLRDIKQLTTYMYGYGQIQID